MLAAASGIGMELSSIPIPLAASQHKHMTYGSCCVYRIVPPDDEQ
jgi:hypothetical protein